MQRHKILIVTGPTASGKTALAIRFAVELGGEIINADSVQVYRGFCIGSGMPTATELSRVPHHLFGFLDPEEEWNAGIFRKSAAARIADIAARGRLPIVAGGTGLYIRALLAGLVEAEVAEAARERLADEEARLRASGTRSEGLTAALHARLALVDPESAAALRPTDTSRVRRAFLVALSGEGSLGALQRAHANSERPYDALVLCLLPDRRSLYDSIERRVDEMLTHGFLKEVEELLARHSADVKPLRSIGYLEAVRHLRGELTEAELRELMKQSTRRFAKRQMTWWRHQPRKLGWRVEMPPGEGSGLDALIALVRGYLLENTSNTRGESRFYPLSGVGFPENLG